MNNDRIKQALKIATDTKAFEMGRDVLCIVPTLFEQYFPGRDAVLIADSNTWKAAGKVVWDAFEHSHIHHTQYVIEDQTFHAEWSYVERVDKVLDSTGAIAVSVGSGVINDLCKLSSHHHGQLYLTVPTAASVDGYASFGASITYQGVKQTLDCPAPVAIVADIDVIASAPNQMTAAGYADLAAKIPCGAEWMIADLFGTEPIQPDAWHVLQDCLNEMLSHPDDVAAGDVDAIALLFEGLTLSGIAMQAARSSRPASCTDHLFSHYLDMTAFRYHGQLQSHGFQVAIGTLTMCAFFDAFLQMDLTQMDVEACVAAWPSLEAEQNRARQVYAGFVDPELGCRVITSKYTDAIQVREQLTKVRDRWPELRATYRAQVYPFDKMQRLFKIVGAPADPADIGLSRKALKAIVPYAQLMRNRINLLDLAKRAMIYDQLVDKVFGPGGVWEI